MKKRILAFTIILYAFNSKAQFEKRVLHKDEMSAEALEMILPTLDSLKVIEWVSTIPFGDGAMVSNENQDTLLVFYTPKSKTERAHLSMYHQVRVVDLENWIIDDFSKVNPENKPVKVFASISNHFEYYVEIESEPTIMVYKFSYK